MIAIIPSDLQTDVSNNQFTIRNAVRLGGMRDQNHTPIALEVDLSSFSWHSDQDLFLDTPRIQKVLWRRDTWGPEPSSIPRTVAEINPVLCKEENTRLRQWSLRLDIRGWRHKRIQTEIEVLGRTRTRGGRCYFSSLCPQCGRTKCGRIPDRSLYLLRNEKSFLCGKCASSADPSFDRFDVRILRGVWSDELIAYYRRLGRVQR